MEKLTLQEAIDYVKEIDMIKNNDESAHSREDDLYSEFIKKLSLGLYSDINEVIAISQEIIKTENIDFCRWYS